MPKNAKNNNFKRPVADLSEPGLFKLYSDYIKHLMTFDLISEANDVRKYLPVLLKQNSNLAKSHPDYYKQYEKIIVLTQFIALSFLSRKAIIDLFETRLADALREPDIILEDKIEAKLLAILFEERDVFKRELREAMLRNNQPLTSKNIVIDGESQRATVGNWIKDYNKIVGAEIASQIDRVEYLTNSVNMKGLSKNDKRKAETLINFYEDLKKSSLTPEGIEEAVPFYIDDEHFVLRSGKLEKIKPDKVLLSILKKKPIEEVNKELKQEEEKKKVEAIEDLTIVEPITPTASSIPTAPSTVEKEVLKAYQGDPRKQKAIAKAESRLNKKFPNDMAKIRMEFFAAVQKKNVNLAIAALRILAQKGDLESFIKEDAKLNKFLTAIWQKRYGQDFVDKFNKRPAQLKFIRLFLRYVLEERLGLSTSDAARVGLQIGNIFVNLGKKGYNKMAYFDVGSKEFRWFE